MPSFQVIFMNSTSKFSFLVSALCLSGALSLLTGCSENRNSSASASPASGSPSGSPSGALKAVPAHFMNPIRRSVEDYEEFTGRIAPFDEVDVRAQVSGTLLRCTFKEDALVRINPQTGELIPTHASADDAPLTLREGEEVREGQLLFEIDPQIYETALASAKGGLNVLEARKKRLENDLKRAERLKPTGAISDEEYDLAHFNLQECDAEIAVAKAEIQKAQINVNYTKIYAPMDGCLCNSKVSVGNLIQANSSSNSTSLVRIVRVDPVFININIDEATAQNLKRIADERRAKDPDAELIQTIEFRLSNESGFTHTAKIDYQTPTLEQSSGTRLIRAVCENPKTSGGERLFQPGMTVHVRICVTERYDALLVPEETLGTNQATRFVYALTAENMPEMRKVELGPIQADNLRVIRSGLKPEDRIITDNLLRIRLDRPVEPQLSNEKY